MTTAYKCHDNTQGSYCHDNTQGSYCHDNSVQMSRQQSTNDADSALLSFSSV